jgi:hypothetical protein
MLLSECVFLSVVLHSVVLPSDVVWSLVYPIRASSFIVQGVHVYKG